MSCKLFDAGLTESWQRCVQPAHVFSLLQSGTSIAQRLAVTSGYRIPVADHRVVDHGLNHGLIWIKCLSIFKLRLESWQTLSLPDRFVTASRGKASCNSVCWSNPILSSYACCSKLVRAFGMVFLLPADRHELRSRWVLRSWLN
jgi:hypothetical protein